MSNVSLFALSGIPMVREGDDVGALVTEAIRASGANVTDNTIVVVAQKIVSKAEGRAVRLDAVTPGDEAAALADKTGKDPRLVQLILNESRRVVRQSGATLITENKLGMIMANAGIDQSNIDDGFALLLPENPDTSARAIAATIAKDLQVDLGIVIADSTGRPWRNGVVGIAIGVHGVPAVLDIRGAEDLHGRELTATQIGVADGIAAAATLLMGQGSEGLPVVLVNGLEYARTDSRASDLLRDPDSDLFR
ncbi:MAG: coenzyme F420-0:L-glutamate ligase [Pseudomonadota bacterium]